MICNNCSKVIKDDAVYCNYCGKKHNPSGVDKLEMIFGNALLLEDDKGNSQNYDLTLGQILEKPDWKYLTLRAGELINKGEYYEALEFCNKALELEKNESLIYNRRGLCYYNLNKNDNAMQDYNIALNINPNDTPTLNNRAILYDKMELYKLAIEDFSKILFNIPSDNLALRNRAYSKFNLKDYNSAKTDISNVLNINPSDVVALYILGITLLKLGETKEGIVMLKKSANKAFQPSINELKNLGLN